MTLPYRIGIIAALLAAAFLSGFFYGKNSGREAALKNAVLAYQTREEIDHETSNLEPIDLCIALGGLQSECAAFMQRLDKTAESQ